MILGPQLEPAAAFFDLLRGDLEHFFERPIAATLMVLALLMLLARIALGVGK
jgi:TctA family transporter